jgi:hypothetical protein
MLRVEPLQTPPRCRVPRLVTVGWETIPPMGAGSLSAHWLMDSLTQRSIENSAAGRLYPGCYPSTACVGAAKPKVRRCRIKLGQTPLCLIVAVVFCAVALFSQHAGVEVVDTRDVQVTWARQSRHAWNQYIRSGSMEITTCECHIDHRLHDARKRYKPRGMQWIATGRSRTIMI